MRYRLLLPLLAVVPLLPLPAWALGIRLPDQDAEATARGNAFTATADNPSAVFYNPAGLMQLHGLSVRDGGYGILIDEHYEPLHGQPNAHETTANHRPQVAPQFYLAYHPENKPFAFGFGLYAPFGLRLNYPDETSFRQAGLGGSLTFLTFNPVIAIQVTRTLSIGIGISANYIDATLNQGLTSAIGDRFQFKGNGLAVGANAGILWKPTPRQSIGLTYHSPVSGDLTGHTKLSLNNNERRAAEAGNAQIAAGKQKLAAGIAQINSLPIPQAQKDQLIANANAAYQAQLVAAGVPASGSFPTSFPELGAKGNFPFPQYAVLGYSFRPTPAWNLEADIDWTDWDSLNTLPLKQSNGTRVTVPFNWTHSFIYELGATRYLPAGYRISAGYMYSENSVPSSSFNPTIPDSARHIFSVGVGRTWGRYNIDLGYQLSYGPTRTIVNDAVSDGRYTFLSNAVTLSLGYQF